VKNGSQAANQRFFAFPEIRLIYFFKKYLGLIIFYAKKILSRGEDIFQRSRFSIKLKRQVIEELLGVISTPAQLMRPHEISSGLLYQWKEQYARGRFDNEPGMD
jgi:hypothetical protein